MRNIFRSLFATGAIQVLNVLSGVLAARVLLPEGRGELAAILLWPAIFGALASANLDKGMQYFAAVRPSDSRWFATVAMALCGPLALVAVTGGYVAMPYVMRTFDADVISLSRLYLLVTPASYIATIALATMLGLQRFALWNVLRVLPSAGYVVAILAFVTFGDATVSGFALAFMTGTLIAAVVGTVFVVRLTPATSGSRRVRDVRTLLSYSLGMHLPTLAEILGRQVDKALVAFFLKPEILGLYVVAVSAAALVSMIGGAITPLTFARVANQTTPDARRYVFGRFFRLTLILSICAAFSLGIVGPWLIEILFGEAFHPAGALLPLLILGSFANTIKGQFVHALQAHAQLMPISVAQYVQLTTLTLLLLFLLPRIGAQGAAWALALSTAAAAIIAGISLSTKLGWNVLLLSVPTLDDLQYLRKYLRALPILRTT